MRNLLFRFVVRPLRKEYGAITVMFAIMFPLLIMFYSVAYDGARFQSSRARLADGINQGVLAVAMVDNRNATSADETANITLLHNYLSYYLPDATISKNDLNITVAMNYSTSGKVESVDYTGSGKASVQPIIGAQREVGFDSSVDLQADNHAGVVRKTVYAATDYALVLNFSASLASSLEEDPSLTKFDLIRKAVAEFMDEILYEGSSNTVGIIPGTSDVPVILPGTNIAGGNNFGCTAAGKLKAEYDNVDLDFWYNKAFRSISSPITAETQSFYYDSSLYTYYKNIVSPATGYSLDGMVNKGWCVKNSAYGGKTGKAEYSCDADPRSRLFDNYTEFLETREAAYQLMRSNLSYQTLFNKGSMDVDGWLTDGFMFSDEAVKTWNYRISPLTGDQPFYYSCYAAFGEYNFRQEAVIAMLKDPTVKPLLYLLELTNDRSIIDEFNDMQLGMLYDSKPVVGLLRALPLIAKGVNQRKIIIVISDGQESDMDTDSGEYTISLFKDYPTCDKIKEGLLRYPAGTPTKQADIYYISLETPWFTARGISASNAWSNYCVGTDHVYVVTDYQGIKYALASIIQQKAPVNFINKDE